MDLYDAYKSGKGQDIDILLGTSENKFNFWVKSFSFQNEFLSEELLSRLEIPILYEIYYKDMNDEDKELVKKYMKILKGENIWKC